MPQRRRVERGGSERVQRECERQLVQRVQVERPLLPSSDSIAERMFSGEEWMVRSLGGESSSEDDDD